MVGKFIAFYTENQYTALTSVYLHRVDNNKCAKRTSIVLEDTSHVD